MTVKVIFKIIIPLLLLAGLQSYGQKFKPEKFEAILTAAINKAYPASVRIWGYDTIKKVQASAQFTGVVVSPEGHILTAAHVNQPGNTYLVSFPNGRTAIALGLGEIELAENKTVPDVAMMKISERGNWPYAEMGWSSSLKTDVPCLSIAYPETLNQPLPSIRTGRIIKLKNERGFIQSSCLMEPGDSGGPLFDHLGRVIAIHSAIGTSEEENYEIPVDLYRRYWTALNQPKTYGALPVVTDRIGTDSLGHEILTFPPMKDPTIITAGSRSRHAASCIRIKSMLDSKEQLVNGSLFSLPLKLANRYGTSCLIISKNSLTGDNPFLLPEKGNPVLLKVISRDQENDLVLLQPLSEIKGGIQLKQFSTDSFFFQKPGRFLISPKTKNDLHISTLGSKPFSLPKRSSLGYLGAMATYKDKHIVITSVQPGSPAGLSGIEAGDQVLSINDTVISNPEDYGKTLMAFWPGDKITFKIKRSENTYSKNLTLGTFSPPLSNHPADHFRGGKSVRRDGFARVFSHDAIISPDQCGGPVFDLNNHFFGINIARFSRTTTLVIPATEILSLIENYRSEKNAR